MGQGHYTPGTLEEPLPGPVGHLVKESRLPPWSAPENPPEPEPQRHNDWTGRGSKARSPGTELRVVLGLTTLLFIVTAGLAVYFGVSKGSPSDGKDGEVLPPCGDDWIWYRNKCYYFSEDEGNWTEAKDSCSALNSSLALIDTQRELDFMLRHKGDRDHWIGLQRETDPHWKWVNGTEFSNWFVVEDYSECAYLSHQRVKSAGCYGKCEWICTKVSA